MQIKDLLTFQLSLIFLLECKEGTTLAATAAYWTATQRAT